MSSCYNKYFDRMINFKSKEDDLWIVTMPKCGTTWMQETAWLVQSDFDFDKAKSIPLTERSPFVELEGLYEGMPPTFDAAENLQSPRLLKSHLPASLLPKELWQNRSKIIYVARNVKDAVVSFQPFLEALATFKGTKEQFIQAFMNDDLYYCPFWPHILEFWEMRHEKNVYFTSYERMKKDLKGVLKDLCEFVGKPIPSEEILNQAVDHLSFDSMKKSSAGKAMQAVIDGIKDLNNNNDSNFQFMRRGIVGSHKDELTADQIKSLDSWSEKFLNEAGVTSEEVFGL
ncbi:hypothetical protein ACFFRR_000645 [Megaselia abdita]